jgi:hypothetical protein
MQFAADPMPLTALIPGFPEPIWRIIATAVAKKREERFARMGDLARALAQATGAGWAGSLAGDSTGARGDQRVMAATSPFAPTVPARDGESSAGWNPASSSGGAGSMTSEDAAVVHAHPTGDVGLAFERDVHTAVDPASRVSPEPGRPGEPRFPTLVVTGAPVEDAELRIQPTRTDPRGLSGPKASAEPVASSPVAAAGQDDGSTIAAARGRGDRARMTIVAVSAMLGMATAGLFLLGPWSPRRRTDPVPTTPTAELPVTRAESHPLAASALQAPAALPSEVEVEAGTPKELSSPNDVTSSFMGRSVSPVGGNQKTGGKKYVLPVFGGSPAASAPAASAPGKKEESR